MRLRIGAAAALVLAAGATLAAGRLVPGSWTAGLLPGGAAAPGSDGARPAGGETELSGRAVSGAAERPVTLRLACDPAGPGLSAVLTVPRFAELARSFDFDGLEGPGGDTAPLTGILVSGAAGLRNVRVPASGAVAADPPTSFTLTVAGARRGEDPLRGIAPGLTEAGARITWTQGSPRKGDAPLVATFSVAEAQASALKSALNGCLARPF